MQFVIANSKTLEDLYWSSDDGWTALDKADRFNQVHTLLYQLPASGFWMPPRRCDGPRPRDEKFNQTRSREERRALGVVNQTSYRQGVADRTDPLALHDEIDDCRRSLTTNTPGELTRVIDRVFDVPLRSIEP